VTIRALEPQHPRAENTDALLDDEAESASPALMQAEAFLCGAMGTRLGVAKSPSRFDLSRVVLDFLFACHKLNHVILDGGTRCDR
jgi:hypothetical protein